MSKDLGQIAEQLRDTRKRVQLIYAFNGTGKTRLSREMKELIYSTKDSGDDLEEEQGSGCPPKKILYYSSFTEDLFYWDTYLSAKAEHILKIQPNSFTNWILKDQGQDQNIIANFQRYASDKLTPIFDDDKKVIDEGGGKITVISTGIISEVTFSLRRGDNTSSENVKISKGEESVFIWSVYYTLLQLVIETLNIVEPTERDTDQFNELEYVFIDDPVSSLDDNHLIQLAVDLAGLIKTAPPDLKFIITTHNPLFYNVLFHEFDPGFKTGAYNPREHFAKYCLIKKDDGLFQLNKQPTDSPFSYHLFLIAELKSAINKGELRKYHYNLLRNVLEKTSTFLGYRDWRALLPKSEDGRPNPYEARIINISSHSKHSGDEVAELSEDDKRVLSKLVDDLISTYRYQYHEDRSDG